MQRFKHSYVIVMQILAFLLSAATFFLAFGYFYAFMLRPSRTAAIIGVSFTVVYILMTRVYGGMDIGRQKAKPIIYSYIANLFVTNLVAHFMLCIMNTTVINEGRFVYEKPLLLIGVYVLQLILISMMAYWGNDLYFVVNKPARCLIVKHPQADVRKLTAKVDKMKKQYLVEKVCNYSERGIFDEIDRVDVVIICGLTASEREKLVSYCYHRRKEIFCTLELTDIVSMGSVQTLFDDTPVMHYAVKGLTFEQRIIKRLMDVVISLVALVATAPIMLLTAIAIKMEDGGPVFYQQPRITYGGREFNVLKFRSMRVADGEIHRSATKNDDRITKVGRVIRKYRIDELPQLINILKSDMSIVGPRPEMVENVEKYTRDLPAFSYRQRAKAGLTGMAQIYGKYNTSPSDKLALDLTYIEQYSLRLDIKLMLRTVLVLLTPEESTAEFEAEEDENIAKV